jgi:hypothetical protein
VSAAALPRRNSLGRQQLDARVSMSSPVDRSLFGDPGLPAASLHDESLQDARSAEAVDKRAGLTIDPPSGGRVSPMASSGDRHDGPSRRDSAPPSPQVSLSSDHGAGLELDATVMARLPDTEEKPTAPQYANPHLSAVKSDGLKQYLYRGKPLFRAYEHGVSKPRKEAKEPRLQKGRGTFHVVEAKYNAASPVLRKTPHEKHVLTHLPDVMAHAEVMDELAQVLVAGDDETRRMAQHFAVEVLKEIRRGQPVFYTQAINGFTLHEYFRNPLGHPELPMQSIDAMGESLFQAIDWLHGKGFFHRDLNAGNVMYDRDRRLLVLVDMNDPLRTDCVRAQARYDAQLARLRNILEQRNRDLD